MTTLKIGALAQKAGISVRTLRYYEAKDLLRPARTEAGQRVYGYADVLRLQQIQVLKRAGFSLKRIREMIGDSRLPGAEILRQQRAHLAAQHHALGEVLSLLEHALACAEDGGQVDLPTLCHIIKAGENAMSDDKWQLVYDKFYTKEEQQKWKKAKTTMPEETRLEYEKQWPELIARAEALVGTDPAAPPAQELAREWTALCKPLYDIDPSLSSSAGRLYDRMDEWPDDGPTPPFSQEVWQFIQAASAAARE